MVNPAQDFRPIGGAIELVQTALFVNRARLVACLAFGAVRYRHDEGLQKGPVVIFAETLFESAQKAVDELLLLLFVLGLWDAHRDSIVEDHVLFGCLFLERCELGLLIYFVKRWRKGDLFGAINSRNRRISF